MQRKFLFLQGVASPFFSHLGDWLVSRGERVYRINFCAGDALYWRGKAAWDYRGTIDRFANYAGEKCDSHAITDCVLFGDQRPLHQAAIGVVQRAGLRLHTFEEGYVRPNYVTLERGLSNAASALPRDPGWYLSVAAFLDDHEPAVPLFKPFPARAMYDMAYHAANAINPIAYRGYRTHRPFNSAVEYAGWGWRYAQYPRWQGRDNAVIQGLMAKRVPYFLVPLQLNGDYQLTRHSMFQHMTQVVERVMGSFAAHAPPEAALVFKNHPLDTGLCDYARLIRRLARQLDTGARTNYIESGHLPTLLEHARGVVTVNSTVGLSALHHGRPTKALGNAVYDIPGLTCQCPLDEFWRDLRTPDPGLYRAYRRVVLDATQIAGDFFTRAGIATALKGCERLLEPRSRLEQLFERFPVQSEFASRALSAVRAQAVG